MAAITITVTLPSIPLVKGDEARAILRLEMGTALQGIVEAVATHARANTPVRTGLLRASIGTRVELGQDAGASFVGTVFTGAQAFYAQWVEEGVGAHVIFPRNKQALFWPGAAHPVRRVNHPGFKGRFMMRNAMDAIEPSMPGRLQAGVDRAAVKIMGI